MLLNTTMFLSSRSRLSNAIGKASNSGKVSLTKVYSRSQLLQHYDYAHTSAVDFSDTPHYMLDTPLTTSYCHTPRSEPYVYKSFAEVLAEAAAKYEDDPAYIFHEVDRILSHRELYQLSGELAAGYVALGLRPGDRIAVYAPSCLEWTLAAQAASHAGLIIVSVNIAFTVAELEVTLKKVGTKALVCAPGLKNMVDYYKVISSICPELQDHKPGEGELVTPRLPDLKHVIFTDEIERPGCLTLNKVRQLGDGRNPNVRVDPDSPFVIQFTSGTTGVPKAATLSHFSILNNVIAFYPRSNFHRGVPIAVPVQFFHTYAFTCCFASNPMYGLTHLIPSAMFDAAKLCESVNKYKPGPLFGTPTMFLDVLAKKGDYDLSSLRSAVLGASPAPYELTKSVLDGLNIAGARGYGMTETSPAICLGDHVDIESMRLSNEGPPVDGVEVKIVDAEDNLVGVGEIGEICTRGPHVMMGYWAEDNKTRESLTPTGWWHTGDLGRMDPSGYICVTGRLKDLVIRGGQNIYCTDIEDVLHSNPVVFDGYAFGIPDYRLGEKVGLAVRLKEGESCTANDIRRFLKERMAFYKVPEHVMFVDDFPVTATGKVKKYILKEKMVEYLQTKEKSKDE